MSTTSIAKEVVLSDLLGRYQSTMTALSENSFDDETEKKLRTIKKVYLRRIEKLLTAAS